MSMHGIFAPALELPPEERPTLWLRTKEMIYRRRMLILIVILPTLLIAAYYYLVASDQYQSEAHFVVRSAESPAASPSGFGQLLGLTGGGTAGGDAASVSDYLQSHDAVAKLRKDIGLVDRFSRPEIDIISRLKTSNLTPESLLKYYNGKVVAKTDRDTGITILTVRAFRAEDAYVIIRNLMEMGEKRVNAMNARSYNDAIASSRRQLAEAETAAAQVQGTLTNYRHDRSDIAILKGRARLRLAWFRTLRANLAAAQAQLETTGAFISRSSPQYLALARQVRSLSAQLAAQSNRLTGSSDGSGANIANNLGGYEDLRLRQEFAGKRYEAAAAALAQARERAQRQQLYLVRVVDADLPVKSLYPRRGQIVLTVFLALLLTYSIGWLIAAGVREHSA